MSRLIILFVRLYQLLISPLSPPCCRFSPSCSQYAIDACKTHGAVRGGILTFKRILRCQPWGSHGFDPVPPKS